MIKSISYERQFIRYLLKRFAGILAGLYGSVRLTYIRTSRYGQFPMSRQNSHIYFLWKKKTLSNTDNGHSRPQRANSYKLNLLLPTLRWSGESQIPIRWICTGWGTFREPGEDRYRGGGVGVGGGGESAEREICRSVNPWREWKY